jgi:phosphoglycerate dehydrogenase-like enzyme
MKAVAFMHRGFDVLATHAQTVDGLRIVRAQSAAELGREIEDADVAMLGASFYTAEAARVVRERAPRLRWIQTASAGYDPFVKHGVPASIAVTNASGVWGATVAEHAMALLLGLTRRLPEAERNRAARDYRREEMSDLMQSLEGGNLLVIGYGSIGREVARRADAFAMRVTVATRSGRADGRDAVTLDRLDTVLPRADAVVACVPLTAATRQIISTQALAAMKPSAVLVNVARGEIVDQAALIEALRAGRLRGAGLDVFETEPLPADDPLWTLPNVILTPHVAGYAAASFDRLARLFVDNLHRLRAGQPLVNRVHIDPVH